MSGKEEPITKQWIVSLAVSVICCAFLLVFFASVHSRVVLLNSKMEAVEARQNNLTIEMERTKRELKEIKAAKADSKSVEVPAPVSNDSPAADAVAPPVEVPSPATIEPSAAPQ